MRSEIPPALAILRILDQHAARLEFVADAIRLRPLLVQARIRTFGELCFDFIRRWHVIGNRHQRKPRGRLLLQQAAQLTGIEHLRSEEHTSELLSLKRISYAVLGLLTKILRFTP